MLRKLRHEYLFASFGYAYSQREFCWDSCDHFILFMGNWILNVHAPARTQIRSNVYRPVIGIGNVGISTVQGAHPSL